MNTPDDHDLISAIHESPWRVVMHVTGGGIGSIQALLTVGGASRTVLDVTIPYSDGALTELVGGRNGDVSEEVAAALAEVAFARACQLAGTELHIAGVGCTAALTTDRERRGSDRAHVAVVTSGGISSETLELERGESARMGLSPRQIQDRAVSDSIIAALTRLVSS